MMTHYTISFVSDEVARAFPDQTRDFVNGYQDALRLRRFADLLDASLAHVGGGRGENTRLAQALGVSSMVVGNWRKRPKWFKTEGDARNAVSKLAEYAAREGIVPEGQSWARFVPTGGAGAYIEYVMLEDSAPWLTRAESADKAAALAVAALYLAMDEADRAIIDAMARRLAGPGAEIAGRDKLTRYLAMADEPPEK